MKKLNQKQKTLLLLSLWAMLTIVLWQFQEGMMVLYPFTVLGTWFHEMGHGLMAIILGGNFLKLEIFPDGSGVATHSGDLFLGGIGQAIVAAAGPLGPTVAGSLFILGTKNPKIARWCLILLSLMLIASGIIWVRSLFGILVIVVFGILTGLAALKGSENVQRNTLLFLGVQACLSVYLSIGYLLSSTAELEVGRMSSDTGVMAEHLLLPHWVWGIAIIFISVFSIYHSLRYALK